ncbi:MAG: class I SAM-dependent methyltransferase [Lachnospiraceae bacterium]|nr:class I SAM-dependent methyltransferase [Lachnospiraceae bacterium]
MQDKEVFIYGTGDYAHRLYCWINNNHICKISGFVVSESLSKKTIYENERVLGIRELLKDKSCYDKYIFLIAIADKLIVKDLVAYLHAHKVQNCYDCSEFISNNIASNSDDHYCLICGNTVSKFNEGGIEYGELNIFTKYHIIGGGKRDNCLCPNCGAIDRLRWVYYVISNYTNIFNDNTSVLHFAPENSLSQRIKRLKFCNYISADLEYGRADFVMDITDIPFKDGTFDYVIANHVLEHVSNEKRAISELKRVIKKTGKLILSFPICTSIATIEEDTISSPEERMTYYGQKDHVRLYGFDYKERLETFGLKVNLYSPNRIMNEEEIKRYGFIYDDIVLICEKK